jgi:hypothetical protein
METTSLVKNGSEQFEKESSVSGSVGTATGVGGEEKGRFEFFRWVVYHVGVNSIAHDHI